MSDRLSVWPVEKEGAWDVEARQHPTMESALDAFANFAQTLKVFGPEAEVRLCYETWKSKGEDGLRWPSPNQTIWRSWDESRGVYRDWEPGKVGLLTDVR